MYNRILKRPMFKRGGMGYSAQGTGITSGLDTPRRGLVQHPGGYAGKTLEELAIEKEEIFAPKKGEWLSDVIGSFGAYGNPYKEDGTAKTIGEMGYDQAQNITKVRTDRENERKLAALSNVEAQEAAIAKKAEEDAAMARTEKSVWGSMEAAKINANRKLEVDRQQEMIQEAELLYQELLKEYITADKIPPEKRAQYENLMIVATKGKYMTYAEAVIAANEQIPMTDKSIEELGEDGIQAARDLIIYQLTGGLWGKPPSGAKGGRVRKDRIGLQQSYPGTAGDAQQASFTNTETVTNSPEGITMTDTMTDTMTEESPAEDIFSGQTEDPYRLLRARLPQEITDDVVRLIAYNEEAFRDFAEIESQSDVMDFNRKYGVELVLPTDDMA
jgi:hypothetical protein